MTASSSARRTAGGEADAGPPWTIVAANNRIRWEHALHVRKRVFHDEQHLIGLDLTDADDDRSLTLVAYMEGRPVATGRLSPRSMTRPAFLSWIATLPEFRGQGIGTAITKALVEAADERHFGELHLSAQSPAISLYERFGFVANGPPYVVRNIEHQSMKRPAPETA